MRLNQSDSISIILMKEIKRVLIHIRWPLQSYTLLGFLFGIVISRVPFSADLMLGFISWFFLCAGITLFNSYYDKDRGPVAGLERPPKTAGSMLIAAWAFKLIGLIIAVFLNIILLGIYVLGIILSILYSHERFRFKSNGYVAVMLNFIVGFMTFAIASSFSAINWMMLISGGTASGLFLASVYMMMQIHQSDEDKDRGDLSIAVLYGRKKTLILAIVLMSIASIFSIFSLFVSQYPLILILVSVLYFTFAIIFSIIWLIKKEEPSTDFRTMNRLTLAFSYTANILLLLIYIFFAFD